MTEKKLNFEYQHPDYVRMELCWRKALDFLRGGEAVLNPDHITGRYYHAISGGQAEGNDSDDADPVKWASSDCKSYLFRHETETDGEFYNRQIRAIHWPLFSPILNIFAAGILRTPPKREGATAEPWLSFHADADRTGVPFPTMIRDALILGLGYGRMHAITDMPSMEGAPPSSLAEQQARGVRPYCYLVHPLDMVDWLLDENDNFVWVVIREPQPENRLPGQERGELGYQYRVWERDGWSLYRQDDKEKGWMKVEERGHPVGEVPISTLYTTRFRVMGCETPLASLLSMDCRLLNKLSEGDTLERFCGFPILGVPAEPDMKTRTMDLGPARAFTYPAGAGAPTWLSPDPAHAQNSWQRNKESLTIARLVGGVSRGRAEDSLEARSAAAIGAESEEKRNQMTAWSEAVEGFDAQIHSHVAKWMKLDESQVPVPSYARNFDLRAMAQQINDVLQLGAIPVVPGPVLAELIKPVVEQIMRENGLAAETIEEAREAIDSKALEVERGQKAAANDLGDSASGGGVQSEKDERRPSAKVF